MVNRRNTRVVVAMSGGVDSSVAAALLAEQGYDVVGIMLNLWSEEGRAHANRCCTPADVATARAIASQLDIPFYHVNVAGSFKSRVVDFFISEYAAGRTPNPCLECNRHIRFGILLSQALGLGAQYLATGHYARIREVHGRFELLRAVDLNKDQSYALSVLGQHELAHALFPLGELTKPEVRAHASRLGLPVAEKAESQDLCFLGDGDYRGFLTRRAPDTVRPGEIRDTAGRVVGAHRGLAFFTIGQRKGLNVTAPEPMYVIRKIVDENAVVVGPAHELGRRVCAARDMHYVCGVAPVEPFRVTAKVRYKAREAPATVFPDGREARIHFDELQRDITPGQGLVMFDGEVVVGQGVIV